MTHPEGSPWSADGSFGQWLGRTRKASDLTRDELAEQIGCSNSTLYKLESGLQRPSKHLAEVLGRRLGVAPGELAAFVRFARGAAAPPAEDSGAENRPAAPPAPLTAFIGREADLAAALDLLAAPEVRILTISGPGGIGKTRLALRLASALGGRFASGAIFVSLAAIRDPALVPLAVARALGLADLPGQAPLDALARAVRQRQLLLILDNFEHLLAAAPAVVELLQAAPRLTIVVTSRSRLRVSGEHLLALQPLDLPAAAPDSPADLAAIGGSGAVRLFVSRAQAIDPRLRLDAMSAPLIAAICRRLEGIPLAIELAAARLRMFPIETLAARLDSRLALLNRGLSDLPARQQSLRATLQWSYDLLAPEARRVLHWLSLFPGGARLEALGAASGDPAAIWLASDAAAPPAAGTAGAAGLDNALLESLETLIDGHLVSSRADADAQPRYGMLETIREYLGELRPGLDEAPAMLDRFGAYHQAMAAAAAPGLSGPHQSAWLDLLDREHDNLRAALQGYLDAGAGEQAIRLAGALGWFWSVRGHLRDGLRWLAAALALGPQPSPERAQALIAAARLACDQGDYAAAGGWLDECLSGCAERGDLAGRAYALNQLGILERKRGNYAAAAAHLAASLELLAGLGDSNGTALALNNLGIVARARQADAEAAEHYRRSLELFRERGNYDGIAMVLNNLGVLEKEQGRYAEAAALYGEALALFRRLANRQGVALALGNLGLIAQRQGRAHAAAELHGEALLVFADLGDRMGVAKCRHSLAELAWLNGRYGQALALYRESLALCGELGFKPGIGLGLYGLAAALLGLGRADAALRVWVAAEGLADPPESLSAARRRLEEACGPADWAAARGEAAGLDWAQAARRALDDPAAPPAASGPAG